ncbi:hypothetical protein D3C80_1147800 [compost metagenome]
MRPYHEAKERDENRCKHHGAVAEQALARERTDNLGNNPERRQYQNIYFRMSKNPENVLPQHRVAASLYIKEVSSQNPVKSKQYEPHCNSRERK